MLLSLNHVSLKHIMLQSLYSFRYLVFADSSSSLLQRDRALPVIIDGSAGLNLRRRRRVRIPPFLPRLRFRKSSGMFLLGKTMPDEDSRRFNSSLRPYTMRSCNGHPHAMFPSDSVAQMCPILLNRDIKTTKNHTITHLGAIM